MSSVPNVILRLEYAPHESCMGRYTDTQKKKYGRARKFYGCHSPNSLRNYVNYVSEGSAEKIDYVRYSGDKEKSYGVFDKNGLMTEQQKSALKKKLRATKSMIWYGFMSFTAEFGNKYVKTYEDAFRLMTKELPKFFKNAGLNPDNMTWYAGLHENTKHKHIHLSFFENEPLRYTARDGETKRYSVKPIPKNALDRFKVNAEQRLTDIGSELRAARDNLTDIMKNVLFSGDNQNRNLAEIQEQVWDLIPLLPEDGRLSYASENMAALRPRIRRISDLLIKSNKTMYGAFNEFCHAYAERDGQTKKMLIAQKIDRKYWAGFLTADKVLEDFYTRFGNHIINTARYFKKSCSDGRNADCNAVRKKAKKQMTAAMLTHCLKLGALAEREAMDAFREYMEKLKDAEKENGQKEQPQNEIE